MAKLEANGTELDRLEYAGFIDSYRSNGKILRKYANSSVWKVQASFKSGVDVRAAVAKVRARYDERKALHLLLKFMHDVIGPQSNRLWTRAVRAWSEWGKTNDVEAAYADLVTCAQHEFNMDRVRTVTREQVALFFELFRAVQAETNLILMERAAEKLAAEQATEQQQEAAR